MKLNDFIMWVWYCVSVIAIIGYYKQMDKLWIVISMLSLLLGNQYNIDM